MPTVPRLGQQQVQGQNLPNIRVGTNASIESFGGGQAFNQMTGAAIEIASEAKRDADKMAVMEADSKLSQLENDIMWGDEGIYKKQGKNAFDSKTVADEKWQSTYDEIYSGLTSDSQRQAFAETAMRRKDGLNKSVSKHVGAEVAKYEDQTYKSLINNERGSAILNYQNPERLQSAFNTINVALLDSAKKNGMSPEATEEYVKEGLGSTHAGVISRMITNGDDLGAKKYYENNKEMIPVKYQMAIDKELEISSTMGFAQSFADQALREGLNENQAYSRAKSIDDPQKRKAAEDQISRQYTMKDRGEQDQQQQLLERATAQFNQTGQLDASMTKLVAGMKPETQAAFKRHIDLNPIRDDSETYYKLQGIAQDPDTRANFMNMDLMKEAGNLNAANLNKLINLQKDLRSGKQSAHDTLNGEMSTSETVAAIYQSAGFDTKKTDEFAKYKLKVDESIQAYKEKTGKTKLTNDEIRDIANGQTMEVITDKGWFSWTDNKTPAFLFDLDTIPAEDMANIRDHLKRIGKPATNKNILDLYNARQD